MDKVQKYKKPFYNQEDIKDSEVFLNWFIEMIENYPDRLMYHLTDTVILIWFGRTIKGQRKILDFIKSTMLGTKHIFTKSFPTGKFEYRNVTVMSTQNDIEINRRTLFALNNNAINSDVTEVDTEPTAQASTSKYDPMAGGDGPHIGSDISECPINKLSLHSADCIKYMQSVGAIEFTKVSYKKCTSLTKWERPCALKVEYTGTLDTLGKYTISAIVYGDSMMSCRRNLLPEFEKCSKDMQ